MPARSGNAHIELILRRLEEDIDLRSPSSDLETLLARVQAATYRRSLIVLVTDETHPQPTPRARELLKRLSVHHRLLIMQVADADPTQLPAGTRIVDVDAGPLPDFLLGDSQIAAEAAARALFLTSFWGTVRLLPRPPHAPTRAALRCVNSLRSLGLPA